MCKCRVPALRDQDGSPMASWGLGQARQMSCQGSDLTGILEACFPKSSCSQPAWQCFCAGADPAASSPTCRHLPASPHQWTGMARTSPSVPPFDAVTFHVKRRQSHCRGERMQGGVGIGSCAIKKVVWQNIKVALQPDPWSKDVGFFSWGSTQKLEFAVPGLSSTQARSSKAYQQYAGC